MLKVGLIVNPVAGMGGAVGLKGTDGEEVLETALARGAEKIARGRALTALTAVREAGLAVRFLTCDGEMGGDVSAEVGVPHEVVCSVPPKTSGEDTRSAAERLVAMGAEVLVFVGGDGTARDVLSAVGGRVPMVGVPSGVKMHSAVFVNSPRELADLLRTFSSSRRAVEAEVMDIDEDAFREGTLRARLYGLARVPDSADHVQAGKQVYSSGSAEDEADEVGKYVADSMEAGVTYVIGPGSTTARVARALAQPKTLLGVDLYRDRRPVLMDASEASILEELGLGRPARVVVSPIGAQGFFLGRGNQQISPEVVRVVGVENVVVVSTPSKLAGTPVLRVDTGDPGLDEEFRGRIKVVTGYKRRRLVTVA